MMKFDELSLANHNEYDVFNLLHDLHQEVPLKEMKTRNKSFYPRVRIGRAWSTPNDTFMHRKNVILVGAGSGISPYLPLLEDAIRSDKGKGSLFEFESVRVIFVARDGEQVSWISNYLFHLIESEWIIPQLQLYIFITLHKEVRSFPSFLFWRAFLLLQIKKQYNVPRASRLFQIVNNYPLSDRNLLTDRSEQNQINPINVKFGRPNFTDLFKSFITPNSKEFHIYSTTSPPVNEVLFDTSWILTKETGVKFHHIYEATSSQNNFLICNKMENTVLINKSCNIQKSDEIMNNPKSWMFSRNEYFNFNNSAEGTFEEDKHE